MTPARFRAIVRQEKLPADGVWRAWVNAMTTKLDRPEGMTNEAHEAGLRATLRVLKKKGLGSQDFPAITDEDIDAELRADPALARAMEGV